MTDYFVSDTDLTSVADAIRAKGVTSAPLSFPTGFSTAIANIPTGGGGWPQGYNEVTLITQNSLGTSEFDRWSVWVYTNGFVEAGLYDEYYPLCDSFQADGQHWLWVPANAWGIQIIPVSNSPDGTDYDTGNITISGQASLDQLWDGFVIRVTGSATITISGVDFNP